MMTPSKHAHVVGLGLIGSSIAMALGQVGWSVTGSDIDATTTAEVIEAGVVTGEECDARTSLIVIATPASSVATIAKEYLRRFDNPELIVTDVAGVKSSIVQAVDDERFLGGHPMAGSELRGLQGARVDLFAGCTWVLTPTPMTPDATYRRLHAVWRDINANVVAVTPTDHDRLVALASHVPHLVAGALMNEASGVAEQDAVLLQLAAGGFRDMTRIAAGDPAIWPDVLIENREAVLATLNTLQSRLSVLSDYVRTGNAPSLRDTLLSASNARRHLPGRALQSDQLSRLRVQVPDRPGVLARITMIASDIVVNIYDIEIAHGIDSPRGTLLLAIDSAQVELLSTALRDNGFEVGVE